MRIKQRLLLSFLTISLVTIGLSYGISAYVQKNTIATFKEVSGEFLPGNIALSRLEMELYRSLVLLQKYQKKQNKENRNELEKSLSSLDIYKTTYDLYQKNTEIALEIEGLIHSFTRDIASYILLLEKNTNPDVLEDFEVKINSQLSTFAQNLDPLIQSSLDTSYEKIIEVEKLNQQSLITQVTSTAFILLLSFFLSLYIATFIANPINQLRDATRRIGIGDLNFKVPVNCKGEIGDLANDFNRMAKKLGITQNLLLEEQKKLEERVEERTKELYTTINELKVTQSQLIENEKMAALGSLVSGVAHEINTPLGVSITANSHLKAESSIFEDLVKNNKLKKSSLVNFLSVINEAVDIIEINLNRSAELIKNFKQVAVDQSVDEIRKIDLHHYMNEVLSSLRPEWKHTNVEVETSVDNDLRENLEITTYPGAIAQIFTNLITNSIKHAFNEGKSKGVITIKLKKEAGKTLLIYADNGMGMSPEIQKNIFNPFFTTQRGTGGTGLGMHIVYNLVVQKLQGTIEIVSQLNQGSEFVIQLPEDIQRG